MRGEKVSVKVKNNKIGRVQALVKSGNYTVEQACRKVRIKRRTYYHYKNLEDKEDKRFKGLSDWQIATLEFSILMHEKGTIAEYVEFLNNMELFNPYDKKRTATTYKVWYYLKNRKRILVDHRRKKRTQIVEEATSLEKRTMLHIKEYGETTSNFFKKDPSWEIWRTALIPDKKR